MKKKWILLCRVWYFFIFGKKSLNLQDKQSKNQKITKADIKKNQEDALLKAMEKKLGISEKPKKKKQNSDDSSDDDNPPLEPNLNHIQREQAILDAEKYSEVIDGSFFSMI